ncbi:MAG: recombination mediator RecR [Candidatus Omnitrophica bacterium]|nr:recombination mediator RecR [Candidatus Omnitrophota bacterium]MDD5487794.1 recombination mediator RecR [Candidatus Omnitrophota bacterium]
MPGFPPSMMRLIEDLVKMPGIGSRSARRLTFHILRAPKPEVETLIKDIKDVRDNVRFCSKCNNLSEGDMCSLCSDVSRDPSRICVVEGPGGIWAIERTGHYKGLYHVLLGELSPIDGVGPEDLKIQELVDRVKKEAVKEVIIATDFTTEGETTAMYIAGILKPLKVKTTRLARGVPAGAMLEYADVTTLQRAFEERRDEK